MFNLKVVKYKKFWLIFSGATLALALTALITWGLNFGIDFTGGSLMEVKFNGQQPNVIQVKESLADLNLSSLSVQPTTDNSIILRFKEDSLDVHEQVKTNLNSLAIELNGDNQVSGSVIEELRFDSVGPSIGKELKNKSFNTISLALIVIIIYIAIVFKKVSKPVASWKYGIAAIIALAHDIIIVLGVFAVLGRFLNVEINATFIAAILTVLGYSVNDTIITFDRTRENLPKSNDNFENTVNKSINQTLTRTIFTSFTTLLSLIAIIIFGGSSIREFVLALAIGIFVGTYSSLFVASPVILLFNRKRK
ncbi:MAG TPA: protein translocase subunit SecF [bacterium]|nr:protein translocase subunit SecF [bacterium]